MDPTREKEWIETLLSVPSEDVNQGIIDWKVTVQQDRILEAKQRLNRLLIVKGRQTRCSTIVQASNIRKALTTWGQNFVVITQTDKMTQNFRQFIIDRISELATKGFPYDFDIDNSDRLRIAGFRSTFHFASAEQKVGLRGINTAHNVHASEIAHWPDTNARRIIGGILPAVPADGTFIGESTPNGAAGWFYDRVLDSMPLKDTSIWTTKFFPWWLEKTYSITTFANSLENAGISVDALRASFIPDAKEEALMNHEHLTIDQMLWRRMRIDDLLTTGQYFAQEYPEDLLSCWLAAGVGFFHDDQFDHITYYRERISDPGYRHDYLYYRHPKTGVISQVSFLGPNLRIWQAPIPGRSYVAFLDTSAGVSIDGDYSALVVLDAETLEHVATLQVRTLPARVGQMAAAVAQYYNTAFLGVERNTYGIAAIERLQELGYPNLFYDFVNHPENPPVGWATSQQTRERLLNNLRNVVFSHALKTYDINAVLEMGGFTWRKVEGRSGNILFRAEANKGNDDMVIALAGAVTIAPFAPRSTAPSRATLAPMVNAGVVPPSQLRGPLSEWLSEDDFIDGSGIVQRSLPPGVLTADFWHT